MRMVAARAPDWRRQNKGPFDPERHLGCRFSHYYFAIIPRVSRQLNNLPASRHRPSLKLRQMATEFGTCRNQRIKRLFVPAFNPLLLIAPPHVAIVPGEARPSGDRPCHVLR
jgi:hypothetical protein